MRHFWPQAALDDPNGWISMDPYWIYVEHNQDGLLVPFGPTKIAIVSHSLGTVSLDKPQILPYPCIKRETSPKLGNLYFRRFLKQDLHKQI